MAKFPGLSILLFLPYLAMAQFHFREKTDIQTFDLNKELKMPFAGGINSAQYQKMDLNGDGVEDLVLFDRTSGKISVFLAVDSRYQYAPDYAALFPEDISGWIMLRDFDCDGDKDIFTSALFGMKVYENNGFAGALINWTLVQDPVYTQGFSGSVNLQMNSTDLPAIEDIDGDGDLDILVFDFAGSGGIELHENQGGCGTFDYVRITKNWGNFKECFCQTYDFGSGCTDIPLNRITHVAPKSVFVRDFNNDGRVDLLVGQAGCEVIDLLENKGENINAVFDSFYKGFPVDNPVTMQYFPAAFMEDVDFDGIDDLLISSNSNPAIDGPMDFATTSYLYKNIGSNQFPEFQLINNQFLQSEMIDLGQGAHPAFLDIDGDGDLDMFVGSDGKGHPDGYYATLYYFENTGTQSLPIFTLIDEDYAGLSALRITHLIPYFEDLNDDSARDLVFTGTSETFEAKLFFIPNSAPDFGSYEFNPANIAISNLPISPGDTPGFFYYDDDNMPDILLGRANGALDLYQNSGMGNFDLKESNYLGITGTTAARYLAPSVGDLDNDGNPDLVTCDSRGEINIYKNFMASGILPSPQSPWLENTLLGSSVKARYGVNATVAIKNIIGSSYPDLVIGSFQGGIHILENTTEGENSSLKLEVKVFPNPISEKFTSGIRIITNLDCELQVFDITGAQMVKPLRIQNNVLTNLDVSHFSQGIYFLYFTSAKEEKAVRVVVLD